MCKSNRVCFSCLSAECYKLSPKSCLGEVPSSLLCTDCTKLAYSRTYNFLVCPLYKHTKPEFKDLEPVLQSFLKSFDSRLVSSLKNQFNLVLLSGSSSGKADKKASKSSPVDPSLPVPAFDTSGNSTGDPVEVSYPSREDPLYIFQHLKIGNETALVFYDTGATGSLVRGEFAERCKFKTIQQESQIVGHLGAQTMNTGYGIYSARLGPDTQNVYHEIVFHGINEITTKFPKYDLSSIGKEVSSSGKLPKDMVLPRKVGGKPVDILMGIRSPELVPQLLFVLPSGIGIFKAPFTDINNTNICFGGTHYSITAANQRFGSASVNHLSFMLSRLSLEHYYGPWMDLDLSLPRPSIPKTAQLSELQTSCVLTTSLSGTDLLVLDSKSSVSAFDMCTCSCHHEVSQKLCSRVSSGFKIKAPVAKLKRSLNGEEDLINYYPTCEDCLDCPSSSLPDSSVQQLISTPTCSEADATSVVLPFSDSQLDARPTFLSYPLGRGLPSAAKLGYLFHSLHIG